MAEPVLNEFPRDLLTKSNKERLEFFRGFTASHPLLLNAYDELRLAVRDSNPGSIIFIYGPTGVGKTTLLKRLVKHLYETLLVELERDQERIPVVSIRLLTPTSGSFDWKEYFKRLLIAMEEPLVDHKLEIKQWNKSHSSNFQDRENNLQLISSDRPGIRPLRFASEQTLRHRRPLAVLIDDAQHFGIISSGRKLLDQLNTIKSQADESEITHVLCGTYELIPLRNLNGQLSRRSIDIHFSRYHAENGTHQQWFINALNTFQQHLPLVKTPNLVSRWEYFYERSLGCVGVLKDWLTRSLALALEDNSPTLLFKHLEQRALSVKQCTAMLREAIAGEKEIEEKEEELILLRKNLKISTEVKVEQREGLPIDLDQPKDSSSVHRKRRVGNRKPVRDRIGVKIA